MNKPEIMKSFKRQISYEEIFKSKKLEEVKKRIIEKEVKTIISQDIEEINKYLKINLKLVDLSKQENWKQFKECFYRRHIIIHNNCYPDEKYKEKTSYKGKKKRLVITKSYISSSIKLFKNYNKLIKDLFTKKFT